MKAAVIRRFGDPDSLAIEEIDTPRPKPRSVVIKVLAAGVNRFDHYAEAHRLVSTNQVTGSLVLLPGA